MKKLLAIATLCAALQIKPLKVDEVRDIVRIVHNNEFQQCLENKSKSLTHQKMSDLGVDSLNNVEQERIHSFITQHVIATCFEKLLNESESFRAFIEEEKDIELTPKEQAITQQAVDILDNA